MVWIKDIEFTAFVVNLAGTTVVKQQSFGNINNLR